MYEDRHPEPRCNFERRARLRGVNEEITTRTVHKKTAQSQFCNRTLNLAGRSVAVISIDRCQSVKVTWMASDEASDIIVNGHDGPVRYKAVRISDQIRGDIDDPGRKVAIVHIFYQKVLISELVPDRLPTRALIGRNIQWSGQFEARRDVMTVPVDDVDWLPWVRLSRVQPGQITISGQIADPALRQR